ncbi:MULTISPECIES: MipA/OmpV family protein [Pseudoalteromonas]|uniref:MipA/OmpV family protein n=1 Tax=Pseudoalteromonas TaxID=53246 RepID=UPI00249D9EC3|tara:strand:- start:964 stop:1827 length:864 start_codon:yes stop_codon:yes gene_type:complete
MRLNTFIYIFCFVVCLVCVPSTASQAYNEQEYAQQHITVKKWHVNLSVGAGVITNPLHGGKNVPLPVIPRIAFYGERWFFDNGRLGYTLVENQKHHFNIVSELNAESRFFIDWHPNNLFVLPATAGASALAQNNPQPKKINIDNIDNRHLALDAGGSYHYVQQNHVLSIQLLHDISNVYNGTRGAIQWQYHSEVGRLKLKPTLGVNYKSAELNSYYYGLKAHETSLGKIDVGSSWQPYAKIDASWPLSEANSLRFHVAYYDYSAMDGSPLFERNYSMTAFIGFDHTF